MVRKKKAVAKTPHPPYALSKTTIRTYGRMAALRMAVFYKNKVGAEVLTREPRYNKGLEMWEIDILKKD